MTLIERLKDEQKTAMKAKNKPRLGAIRLVSVCVMIKGALIRPPGQD